MANDIQVTSLKLWAPEPLHLGISAVKALIIVVSTALQIRLLAQEFISNGTTQLSHEQLPLHEEESCLIFASNGLTLSTKPLHRREQAVFFLSSLILNLLCGKKKKKGIGYRDFKWFCLKAI